MWTIKRPLSGRGLGHVNQFGNFSFDYVQSTLHVVVNFNGFFVIDVKVFCGLLLAHVPYLTLSNLKMNL